ncbi:MAG: hypothetical protein WCH43_17410, partial [Verrucomicrobiota bacterium]
VVLRGDMPVIAALKPVETELSAPGILQGKVQTTFVGNGRDQLRMTVVNRSERAIQLQVSEGQTFANPTSTVVVVRPCNRVVNPGETLEQDLQTAAISSANRIGSAVYTLSKTTVPRLNELLAHLRYHPEISPGTIQTVVLALTENLPASAFARYSRPDADIPSRIDTTPFRVDTTDLICALIVLRDIGMPNSLLSITVDPQLKSEAMIDPLAHAFAMAYYKIPFQNEWSYWKGELLQGDPALRHYALYGIARFFPDVAIQMLPKWARAKNLPQTYRQSAVQALVETGRSEAISVLQQFEHEFGNRSDLGKSARVAEQYLNQRLDREPPKMAIAYRTTRDVSLRQPTVLISVVAAAN